MRWLTLLIAGLLFSVQQVQALEPYPQSGMIDEQQRDVVNYRLVMSELKREQAVTSGEQERRLNGHLWRRVWNVGKYLRLEDIAAYFANQIKGTDVLYQCKGLDCGSSNFWGNEIFSNGRLVGLDKNQVYQVLLKTAAEGATQTLYVLYVVERGTGQIMVDLDILTTRDRIEMDARIDDRIQKSLSASSGWLPGMVVTDGRLDSENSKALIDILQTLTPSLKRRLYLVVHCYEASHMADNIQCSQRLAEQLRVATFDGQYDLNISGHGALTPAPEGDLKPALRFVFWPGR